ncbi:hypothetical protein WJX72_007404 [[Myrmecia] bisecta]|uniref:U-box domain-containing protein n=1 Tax=[Myrmecia] bisecta TaxID=41462 RepID=A0AAW1R6T2_9CHLO
MSSFASSTVAMETFLPSHWLRAGGERAVELQSAMAISPRAKKAEIVGLVSSGTSLKATRAPRLKLPGKKKGSKRARELVEQYGHCPISMEPMRRPVLPSSGQAFEEINIVRYCAAGNKRCPISGVTLKFSKGKGVCRVADHALRNVIRAQADVAKVYIPPLEKDRLLKDLEGPHMVDAVKALVDDTYLGYVSLADLQSYLGDLVGRSLARGSQQAHIFFAIVAECLACRSPDIVRVGVHSMSKHKAAWEHPRVILEALSVAQDPDCRGTVLCVIENRFRNCEYTAQQAKAVLSFETESVPVQQCQVKVAQLILEGSNAAGRSSAAESGAVINQALEIMSDLSGYDVYGRLQCWMRALDRLRKSGIGCSLDEANLERLFLPKNRGILGYLAAHQQELLEWHMQRHTKALGMCIRFMAHSWRSHHARGLDEGAFDSNGEPMVEFDFEEDDFEDFDDEDDFEDGDEGEYDSEGIPEEE